MTKRTPVTSITMNSGEGLISWDAKYFGRSFPDFTSFDDILAEMAAETECRGTLKIDFTVNWADGESYDGTFYLSATHRDGSASLAEHMADWIEYKMTQEISDETRTSLQDLRDEYQLA